ncbi:MAG: TRAP transporter substrate-binding protein DctP [Flavobacteriaceae bacterium]
MRKLIQFGTCALAIGITAVSAGLPVLSKARAAEVEGPQVKWLVSLWGNRRGATEGIEKIAEYVGAKTDGKFNISPQYGEVLSNHAENLDGLKIGAFESAMFCPFQQPDKTSVLNGLDLALLPIDTLRQREYVTEAYYKQQAVLDEFAKWGAVPIMGSILPNWEVMGTGTPPTSLEDWKGKRILAGGGVGDVLRGIGVVVTYVPGPEAYQALERNVIDGVAYPYTYAFGAYKLQDISTWVTDRWSLGSTVCHFAAAKSAYEALPQQYKDLLNEAKGVAYDDMISKYETTDQANEKKFKEAKLTRVEKTPAIKEAIEVAAKPSWEAWAVSLEKQGLPGKDLLAFILKTAADAKTSN